MIGINKSSFNYIEAFFEARTDLNEEVAIFLEGYGSSKYIQNAYKRYIKLSRKINNMLFK